MEHALLADVDLRVEDDVGMDHGPGSDPYAHPDHRQRAHVHAFSQLGGRVYDRGRMNAGERTRLGMQYRHRAREGEIRIGGQQAGQGSLQLGGDDHRGGAGGSEAGNVTWIGNEREVAGTGVVDSAHPAHIHGAVTPERTSEARGQLAEVHPASNPPAG